MSGWRKALVPNPSYAGEVSERAAVTLGDWGSRQPGTRQEQRAAVLELLQMTGLAVTPGTGRRQEADGD